MSPYGKACAFALFSEDRKLYFLLLEGDSALATSSSTKPHRRSSDSTWCTCELVFASARQGRREFEVGRVSSDVCKYAGLGNPTDTRKRRQNERDRFHIAVARAELVAVQEMLCNAACCVRIPAGGKLPRRYVVYSVFIRYLLRYLRRIPRLRNPRIALSY